MIISSLDHSALVPSVAFHGSLMRVPFNEEHSIAQFMIMWEPAVSVVPLVACHGTATAASRPVVTLATALRDGVARGPLERSM